MTVELNSVVQEVVIDDSRALAGSARVVGAMEAMAAASDKATDATKRQAGGFALFDQAVAKLAPAQESALRRLNQWKAQADPVEGALQRLSRAENDLNRAISQGLSTDQEKLRVLDQLWSKLLGAAEAQEKLNSAIKAQSAQSAFNTQLGVKDDFGGAARAADIAAYGQELERLRSKYNPLYAVQRQYLNQLNEIKMAYRSGVIPSTQEYEAAISQTKTVFAKQVVTLRNGAQEIQKFGGMSRGMGVAVQQAGYQVGDFFVQVSSGQGVMRPLIQQGTQLVSMFGPWGAVIGAAGAIVGALTTSLWGAHAAAEAAHDGILTLEQVTKTLTETMNEGNKSARQAALDNLGAAHAADARARSEINLADAILARAKAQLDTAIMFPDATGLSAGVAQSMSAVSAAQKKVDELSERIDDARIASDAFGESLNRLGADYSQQIESNNALITALGKSRHEYDVTAKMQEILSGKFTGTENEARALAETLISQKDTLDKLTGSSAAYTKQVEQRTKSVNDNIATINAQIVSQKAIADAYDISSKAGRDEEVAQKARLATLGLGKGITDKLTASELGLAAAMAHTAATVEHQNALLGIEISARRARAAQITDPNVRHAEDLAIARQEKLNDLTQKYRGNIEDINKGMRDFDADAAYKDQERYWNAIREKASSISDDVSQFLVDGFVNAANGGKSAFDGFWDGVLAGAKRTAANIATEFLKQKIIMPVVTQIVGDNSGLLGIVQASGGVSGADGGGAIASGSGGASLSSLSSLASLGGSMSGVKTWAANLLGLGSAAYTGVAGAAGTALGASAAVSSGATLSTIYAGGASGSIAAGALGTSATGGAATAGGLTAGLAAIPVWGWIALAASIAKGFVDGAEPGTVKGTVNTLLAPSLSEWQSNPRRSIANAFDPVGLALSDLGVPSFLTLGGTLNKLLGNTQPSNQGTAFVVNGMADVSGPFYNPSEYSAQNTTAARAAIDVFTQLRDEILAVTGGTFSQQAQIEVGSRDGVYARVGSSAMRTSDLDAAVNFLVQGLAKGITGVMDEDYKRILSMGGTAETLYENLSIAKQIKEFSQSPDLSQASDELATLVGQFSNLRDRAISLGLAVDSLDKAQANQLRTLSTGVKVNFTSTVKDFIGQYLDPLKSLQESISIDGKTTYDKFIASQSLFRDIAEKAGQGNDVALGLLAQAGADYADFARNLVNTTQPLRDFMESLKSGSLSNLTPLQQLQAAQGSFNTLSGKVAGGDISSIPDLQQAAQTYLQIAREYGASGKVYQDAYTAVTGSLGDLITSIDGAISGVDSTSVLDEINAAIGPLIDELQASQASILDGIEPSLNDLNANFRLQIDTLKDEGVQTRTLLAQIASALDAVPGHASGGLVSGIGSGASDSNLRWLSAGEYVAQSSIVQRMGTAFFDNINSGRIPVMSGGTNDNRGVIDALYHVGTEQNATLITLVQEVRHLRQDNIALRDEFRRQGQRAAIISK